MLEAVSPGKIEIEIKGSVGTIKLLELLGMFKPDELAGLAELVAQATNAVEVIVSVVIVVALMFG